MRGYLSAIGHTCSRAMLASRDLTTPARGRAALSGRAGRAVLATAIAASLLLPFSGGSPTVASAAAPNPADTAIRPALIEGELTHLALIPGENEARYIMTVDIALVGLKQAACTTRDVTGEIVLAPDGTVVAELSKIVLDQRTLKCESPLNNKQAQDLLQTNEHPFAEFSVQSAPGLGLPLPAGATAFQLAGEQRVRGQAQPTVYDTAATLTPEGMVGKARTTLKMTSFGITPPNRSLYQVADDMIAEVDLKTTIASIVAAPPAEAPAAEPSAVDPAAAPAAGATP